MQTVGTTDDAGLNSWFCSGSVPQPLANEEDALLKWIQKFLGQPPLSVPIADQRERLETERSNHRLASETLNANDILRTYPPRLEHAKKKLLFDIALVDHPNATVTVDRYEEIGLPELFLPYSPSTKVTATKGYFQYEESGDENCYMNFAHHHLFHGYGHFMFAQDEIQVAEHPVLASIRELMLTRDDSFRPLTVENGQPTPIVFRSVPRTVRIDSRQIYGARFARSDDALIRESVQPAEKLTSSTILAIEAPISSGNRIYTRPEIEKALRTAFSGFRAFILSTAPIDKPTVLHTGNWGCGAYGGNRQLMISIQIMAASLAGISKVVFYCGADSTDSIAEFESQLKRRFGLRPGVKLTKVVDRLVAAAFPWGMPDGN